jgi:perosamine synthetase
MNISFFHTYVHPTAGAKVGQVLQTTFLSEGKLVKEFEAQLSQRFGFVNPVALNSGTTALHLALVLGGIGQGDEVICAPQTFVASALVIVQQGAIPVFADIEYETGNIDPQSIEAKITAKTKAIMAVHWGGYPCDMDEITKIARRHGLLVIEDAAHALGATYKSKPIGSISDYTCFSFQAIKHVTTGDGGAISCLNEDKAREAFTRRWFGIDRANSQPSELGERIYNIEQLGFKYHLNDYAAALGLANLSNFEQRLLHLRRIAQQYDDALKNRSGLQLFERKTDRLSAHWLYGMHVEQRIDFVRALHSRGVPTSVVHLRIDHNTLFGGVRNELTNQNRFNDTQIHIPIHSGLTDEMVAHIIDSIKKGW